MASDEKEVPPAPPEDQRDDGEATETGVLPDPEKSKDIIKSSTESAGQEESSVDICKFFLKGKCHFGHRCRMSHSNPSVDDSEAATPDQDDKPDQEKSQKNKKKENKPNKLKHDPKGHTMFI